MLSILHISDFHYRKEHHDNFQEMVGKMAKTLENEHIDVVVFSGDLVYGGKNVYADASNCLFSSLIDNWGLNKKNIVIVPGNHDLSRGKEMQMVDDSINTKSTVKLIDEFCADNAQLNFSCTRFEYFQKYIEDFYNDGDLVIKHPLYTYQEIIIEDKKYGFVGLNSAWRSKESEMDRGHLVYPISIAREALEKAKSCQMCFCVMHHDLMDFKDFIAQELEDVIFTNCHFLLTGHYHNLKTAAYSNSDIGLIHSVAPSIFNQYDKTSTYGFSLWKIDEETYEAVESVYLYTDKIFQKSGNDRHLFIPMNEEKWQQIKFRTILRENLLDAKIRADKDFVSGRQKVDGTTFQTLFKSPVIKDKSIEEQLATDQLGVNISLDDLINKNDSICLVGTNKCGKTSILRKLQILTLEEAFVKKTIPIYISYKEYKGKEINIKEIIRIYLRRNRKELEIILKDYKILILIDDLNMNDQAFIESINESLQFIPNTRVIVTIEGNISRPRVPLVIGKTTLLYLFIHSISEREIHQLTLSWPNIPKERKYEAEQNIIKIFRQMNLPFNFWTVSLFLWIFEKTDEQNIHNNFELVKLYIDELLGRSEWIKDSSIILEYEDLKKFLGELAYHLLKNGKNGYKITYAELVIFTSEYRDSHMKFSVGSRDLINILIDKQVLECTKDLVTYRLNGVFEYFLAYHMTENTTFLNSVLENKEFFLSFGNELEFYAGFKRDDFNSVKKIFTVVKELLSDFTKVEEFNNIDEKLISTFKQDSLISSVPNKAIELYDKLTEQEKDEIMLAPSDITKSPISNTEVRQKKQMNLEFPIDVNSIEKALFVLGRVYRNSNICNSEEISADILNYLLMGSSNLGFLHTENVKNEINENLQGLIGQIANIMPIVVAAFIFDAIGQLNLKRVFEEKFNELCENPKGNEYLIFLTSLILTDLEYTNLMYWDRACSIIDIKGLRFALMNKLLLLRVTHSSNKEFDKQAIERLRKLIPEFDDPNNKLHDSIEYSHRQSLLKKTYERLVQKQDYN